MRRRSTRQRKTPVRFLSHTSPVSRLIPADEDDEEEEEEEEEVGGDYSPAGATQPLSGEITSPPAASPASPAQPSQSSVSQMLTEVRNEVTRSRQVVRGENVDRRNMRVGMLALGRTRPSPQTPMAGPHGRRHTRPPSTRPGTSPKGPGRTGRGSSETRQTRSPGRMTNRMRG